MSPEEITALFADAAAKFAPILGNPKDDDLTALREVLTPLLLSIPYDEDGVAPLHNLVGLIEPSMSYSATWHAPFPVPGRPTRYDVAIANDATPVVRARMEAAHNVRLADYASFEAAERAVVKFIRGAVDEIWYKDLKDPRTFYNSVTSTALLAHLDANCGGLHPVDLINLPSEMIGYYATAEGIPEYINALEDAQRKLARAKLPMADVQLLAMASTAVLASDHFPRTTDAWEALPPASKTWTAWKSTYREAHIARKRQLLASGGSEPMGGAHSVTAHTPALLTPSTYAQLDGYLDNLANAATQEKTTLADLVASNVSLTASVATLTTNLANLTAAYSILANGKPPPALQAAPRGGRPRGSGVYAVGGYCWTHGFQVHKNHSSATCKHKADGHKDCATRANTMNGSTANKGWEDA